MGIMFYELLTGSLPFKGDTAFEIALKQIKDDIPSVREFNNSIPQSVENVVLKATAKNPKNRYSSAKEMHDDLLTVLDENRLDEPRVGFKYVEHDGNITKDDLIIDENDERKNGIKLEEDTFEAGHKTNVVLWVLSGIFTMIILALVILFLVSPSINKVPDVKIPDVKNMTVIEAEKVLHKEGFEVASEIEQVGSDEVEKGYIVKTSPSIGRTVKKGTEITLYESKGPLKYTIEDYTGKNYIEVKTILENNYGLNVVIEKKEVDDDKEYDENIIIDQDLKVGTEVSKGANITLYIPDIIVKYPDFTDGTWTQSDIESFCKKYGIDVEFKYEPKPGFNDGDIISQSRAKDTPVIRGVKIEIHVATTYEPPESNTETETETD
jgi:serine/threonine-protein kinase